MFVFFISSLNIVDTQYTYFDIIYSEKYHINYFLQIQFNMKLESCYTCGWEGGLESMSDVVN